MAVNGFVTDAILNAVSSSHPTVAVSRRPPMEIPTARAGTFQAIAAASQTA